MPWLLLAQADPGNWGSLTAFGSLLVNAGFAGFVGWYLLTKALPAIVDKYTLALGEQQKGFASSLKDQQTAFDLRDSLRRSDAKDQLAMVLRHCESENHRRDDLSATQMEAFAKCLSDNREVMEEVREALGRLKP